MAPQDENSELLTFVVCGSVDDGKSTLIGRLLFDSKSIFEDQLAALQSNMLNRDCEDIEKNFDLAHLTDGLRAEREQGITIDVAYRYFATPRRRFIIADTPGHLEYTRNMVTGASNATVALILVNAHKGVVEQTRRHSYIASLLGIQHLLVCINKMDLVHYSEDVFVSIQREFLKLNRRLQVPRLSFVPMSALQGDNVVHRSKKMLWYQGPPLLELLESIDESTSIPESGWQTNEKKAVLPVQLILRAQKPEGQGPWRGLAGQIAEGEFKRGDEVMILPAGTKSRIDDIQIGGKSKLRAIAPQSVTLVLEDEVDVSRGDTLVFAGSTQDRDLSVSCEFQAQLCWMQKAPLDLKKRYLLKQTTKTVQGFVKEVQGLVDINWTDKSQAGNPSPNTTLEMNDIGQVSIKVSEPLVFKAYRQNRKLGSFILIDAGTHATAAAGMILGAAKIELNWEI